jgi:hypothetical protein
MRKKGRRKKGLVKGETFSLLSVGRFGLHSLSESSAACI